MKLKLNTGSTSAASAHSTTPTASTPAPNTASSGMIKLKFSKGTNLPPTPSTEAPAPAESSSAKPPKKLSALQKKRNAKEDISPAAKRAAIGGPQRKISIKIGGATALQHSENELARATAMTPTSGGPKLKLNAKKKHSIPKSLAINVKKPPPPRPVGVGYDSEDSEAEKDPAIEQQFILRMVPGEDANYLREAINLGTIGLKTEEKGNKPAEVSLRWLGKDLRRAIVTVRGRMYAAALVDLPCIVETMKSWDKRGWWKVADICQMLLVLGRCSSEEDAMTYPLPREVDKTNMAYAHGLTPPLHHVRKRRFRKRVSYHTLEHVEEEVQKLLDEDELAEAQGGTVEIEMVDLNADTQRQTDDEEDAEGEDDFMETTENDQQPEYEYTEEEEADDDEIAAGIQAAMAAAEDDDGNDNDITAATPSSLLVDSPLPLTASAAPTPGAETPAADITTADEEESSDEDSSDEDEPDVVDEDALAKTAERNQQLEEVADLERDVANARRTVEHTKNQLLKEREVTKLRMLEEDLRVKRQAFGLEVEE